MPTMMTTDLDAAAVDLTADAPWEYRVIVAGQPRPWW